MKSVASAAMATIIAILFAGCAKDNNDIDEHTWRLTNIETVNGFSSKVPVIDRPERDDRYLLRFNKESATAQMFLIANNWSAHYQLTQNGTINLLGNTTTEVGYIGSEIWVEDTINCYGSDDFNYKIKGRDLTLQSEKMTMVFRCNE
ncbi:MAG: hypothetical protein J6V98_05630 [Bacteroidales bacterium]|nr:hypothetical protein [Bacteroidales bacterium]